MPRFFIGESQKQESTVVITDKDAFHIARTLRMAVGDQIKVCDSEGVTYTCNLTEIRDERVLCEILSKEESNTESPVNIHLYAAWPKGDKAETIVQKAVELGALDITFFASERCIKHPKDDKLPHQIARLQKIAEEAAKQCGRSVLPSVKFPLSFEDMLKSAASANLPLFCFEGESACSLREAVEGKEPESVAVIVGAEGGFSEKEANLAKENGCVSVHLGKRILRCETAPLVALSALLYTFEL